MADRRFSAATAAVTLSSATAKTVIQVVAPSAYRVKILSFSVSFAGNSATAVPVVVRLLRQTTAGTMSSLTPNSLVPLASGEAIQSTAQHTATSEPTAGDTLRRDHVHPQTGLFYRFTPGQEPIIGHGGRVGIECTAPAGVDVICTIECEE